MKLRFQLVIILFFILFTHCQRENSPALDYPSEFLVTKGTFVDRINLSWVGPPKSQRFEILRADGENSEYKLLATTENSFYSDSSSHIVNQKYYYKVRVFNTDDEFSNYTNFDYGFVSKFEAPVFYPPSVTNNEYISLNWSDVNGSAQYFIYRSSDSINYDLIGNTILPQYIDNKDIVSAKTYYYKIKAFNKLLGYSDFSDVGDGYIYQTYTSEQSFGSFSVASYIDFDSKGNIYVVDAYESIVKKFDKDYTFIKDFITLKGSIFRGIKITEDDSVLVAESEYGKIAFFDPDGILVREKKVTNGGVLRQITIDLSGNIYVADVHYARILKLDSKGDLIKSWELPYLENNNPAYGVFYYNNSLLVSSVDNSIVAFCSLDGELIKTWRGMNASCIAMDSNSNFYFACRNRIVKTDNTGKIVAIIGSGFLKKAETVNVCENGDVLITDENIPYHVFIYRQIR